MLCQFGNGFYGKRKLSSINDMLTTKHVMITCNPNNRNIVSLADPRSFACE